MKVKKLVAVFLTVLMLLSSLSMILYADQCSMHFTDVTEGSWYYDHVMYAYENGIMAGINESEFLPHGELTRAMAVQMLYSMAGKPVDNMSWGNPYDDVFEGAWYYDAILWARHNKISSGVGNRIFAPDTPITRAELSVMLLRYARLNSLKLPEIREPNAFVDKMKIPDYASLETDILYQAGIISGKPGNLFDSKGKTTRAEAAVMFSEFIKNTEEQSFDLLTENGCSFGDLIISQEDVDFRELILGFRTESLVPNQPEKVFVTLTTHSEKYAVEAEENYFSGVSPVYTYTYKVFDNYDRKIAQGESVKIDLTVYYGEESETYTLYLTVPFWKSPFDV